MGENADYLGIIKQAKSGNRASTSQLAESARKIVFVYILRITLDYHLSEDLSQETILEMLRALNRLNVKNTTLFKAWLYRTALGKVQHHFRNQGNKRIESKTIPYADKILEHLPQERRASLDAIIQKELLQAVTKAMSRMKVTYRNVLTLRCLDEMSYAEIATVTGGTELQARLLFFRARQSLKKQLARDGFRKKDCLSALGLFGVITEPFVKSTVAISAIGSTAAKAGLTAAIIGSIFSTQALVTIAVVVMTTLIGISTYKTFTGNSNIQETNLRNIVSAGFFELPSSVIRAYDADSDGWKAVDYVQQGQTLFSVSPDSLLVGPRKQSNMNLVVILSKGDWLEFGYSGQISDGPGVDVCIDGRFSGKYALIFITDGEGQEVQLNSPVSYQNFGGGYRMVGFDISNLSLPFEPRAVRIVGVDDSGPWSGEELYAAWARVSR